MIGMFGSRNRSRKESREAVIASLPVDENGDVPEDFLRRRNNLRSRRSIIADGRSTARKVYPRSMPPEQAVSWVMNPGRYDVEGIDCDGKANVPRKGTKASKPKAPAGKKAKPKGKPKAKKPVKPRSPKTKTPPEPVKPPVPAKAPGAVVSGKEIADVAKLHKAMGIEQIALGNNICTYDGAHVYVLALSRPDGRGMFGLDSDEVGEFFLSDIDAIAGLDEKALYKVSLEGEAVVFRTGPDFAKEALTVSAPSNIRSTLASRLSDNVPSSREFDLDTATLARVVRQMGDTRAGQCVFISSKEGTNVVSSGGMCEIEAIVGSPVEAELAMASYPVQYLNTVVKAVAPYVDRAKMMKDYPLVLEGTFGDYRLTAMIAPRVESEG